MNHEDRLVSRSLVARRARAGTRTVALVTLLRLLILLVLLVTLVLLTISS